MEAFPYRIAILALSVALLAFGCWCFDIKQYEAGAWVLGFGAAGAGFTVGSFVREL